MSTRPDRGTTSDQVTLALKRLARSSGADTQEVMTLYVLEALLARLAASPHRQDLVLKGGVLLAAYALRRTTKDIDLQAARLSNDEEEVASLITAIAVISLDDGVVFDTSSIKASMIRDQDTYPGVRVKLVASLGKARLTVGVDVNFGDPIHPEPAAIALPRLLPQDQPIIVLGYPLPMVLAEKIVTAIDRGEANTRWRDFADIFTLIQTHDINTTDLAQCLRTVADYRQVPFHPLLPTLSNMPGLAQTKWAAWRRRTKRTEDLPELFGDVLRPIADFIDPLIRDLSG